VAAERAPQHAQASSCKSRPGPARSAGHTELFDLVGTLPYRQCVVVVARYWLDWSEAEIATALGCRPGTVKSLASRGLARLREEMLADDRS